MGGTPDSKTQNLSLTLETNNTCDCLNSGCRFYFSCHRHLSIRLTTRFMEVGINGTGGIVDHHEIFVNTCISRNFAKQNEEKQ